MLVLRISTPLQKLMTFVNYWWLSWTCCFFWCIFYIASSVSLSYCRLVSRKYKVECLLYFLSPLQYFIHLSHLLGLFLKHSSQTYFIFFYFLLTMFLWFFHLVSACLNKWSIFCKRSLVLFMFCLCQLADNAQELLTVLAYELKFSSVFRAFWLHLIC